MRHPLRIGTRRSALAMVQAEAVRSSLAARGALADLVPVVTEGDRVVDRPLDQLGVRGVFTSALEEALLRGEIDAAVHSLKDVPTRLGAGLVLAAVTEREDPRDAAVLRGHEALSGVPAGARIGTSSVRRAAMLRLYYPTLDVAPVRGNLDTRIGKLDRGEYDGLVLAAAGLHRLTQRDRVTEYLDPDWMVPAPGQGALAIETRADDADAVALVRALEDPVARRAVEAERRVLDALGGNCQLPVGAYARFDAAHREWTFSVFVGAPSPAVPPMRRTWRGAHLHTGTLWMLEELSSNRVGGAADEGGR
jgi:hydroxymethylbilane synthase